MLSKNQPKVKREQFMKDFYVPDLHELLDEAAGKFGDKPFIKYIQDYEIVEKSYRQVRDDAFALCRYFLFNSNKAFCTSDNSLFVSSN